MKFDNRMTVPLAADDLWPALMDVELVAQCIPGIEEFEHVDGDTYRGMQRIRVGPISLRLRGTVTVVERRPEDHVAVMAAEGKDTGSASSVKATITMRLEPSSAESTDLVVTTDARVMGKLGEFGQPIIKKKADQIMREFAKNLGEAAVGNG